MANGDWLLIAAIIITLLIIGILYLGLKMISQNEKRLYELEETVLARTSQLEQSNQQLQSEITTVSHLSIHDHMTGLYNRLYFEKQLSTLDRSDLLPISIITGDVNVIT